MGEVDKNSQVKLCREKTKILENNGVSLTIAQFFIEKCAMWDHPTGRWVHAPKHARRIANGRYGWEVEFGANSFLVGRAIERSTNFIRDIINKIELGEVVYSNEISSRLNLIISGSVSNYEGEIFDGYYAIERGLLRFGNQGIDVNEFKSYIMGTTEINKLTK